MYAGKKLRKLRLDLDINQTEMAESLDLSQSYYSAVEAGKRKITPKMIEKIKNKWKIDEGYFFDKKDNSNVYLMRGKNEGVNEGVNKFMKLDALELVRRSNIISEKLQQVIEQIRIENPELNKLNNDIALLYDFQEFISNYMDVYLEEYWSLERPILEDNPEQFNYDQYKQKKVKILKKYLPLKPAMDEINTAIVNFLIALKQIPTKHKVEFDFARHGIKI